MRDRTGYLRFVGVTVNITDCLFDDKGSTPLRTALKYSSILPQKAGSDTPFGLERLQVRILSTIQNCLVVQRLACQILILKILVLVQSEHQMLFIA